MLLMKIICKINGATAQHFAIVLFFSIPFGVCLLGVILVQKINFEKVAYMHSQDQYFSMHFL